MQLQLSQRQVWRRKGYLKDSGGLNGEHGRRHSHADAKLACIKWGSGLKSITCNKLGGVHTERPKSSDELRNNPTDEVTSSLLPYGDCVGKRDDDDFWKESKLMKMIPYGDGRKANIRR